MFQRIFVPLDGSPGAERAIPVAARLARRAGGTLVLFHVVPPDVSFGGTSPKVSDGEQEAQALTNAATYLAGMIAAHPKDLADVPTEMDVAFGLTSPLLASTARLEHIDLIVMCSHRETHLGQWGLASIAQQTMRRSPAPLLILREHGLLLHPDTTHPLRVIVPLDGSLFAEAALEPAIHLLSQLTSSKRDELCLLQVVEDHDIENAGGSTQARQKAERYLQAISARLRRESSIGRDFLLTSVVSVGEQVAKTILEQTKQSSSLPLIAMATHGREGVQRLMFGSVAERVFDTATSPLLIVCPASAANKTAKPGQPVMGKREQSPGSKL